ncbi:MAG TPA: CBS domain-containing protein, partial [Bacteroidales bacterium]|nr:CBS domain-containing protein [Bacteroidales bacterium]
DEALKIGDRIAIMKDGVIVQIGTPEEILTNPADDYVEKFVQDVDRSKVFTASHVMIRPETIQLGKAGPRVALQRMKQAEISSVYVTTNTNELYGIVTAEAAAEAVRNGIKELDQIVDKNVPTVSPDVALIDLFEKIHNTPIPMAVTEDGILKGIIVRGAVLAALSRSEVKADE